MTMHYIFECQDCGEKYSLQVSGWGSRKHNKGATRVFCSKCAPKNPVYGPFRRTKWVPTTEVTKEQMFEWYEEDVRRNEERAKEAAAKKEFFLPVYRVFPGLFKSDGSDFTRSVVTHGYHMEYWVKSGEVERIRKMVYC